MVNVSNRQSMEDVFEKTPPLIGLHTYYQINYFSIIRFYVFMKAEKLMADQSAIGVWLRYL